VEGNSCLD